MTELTIGEVALQAGIRASAIRYYESVGLLPLPPRVSGQRRYQVGICEDWHLFKPPKRLALAWLKCRRCSMSWTGMHLSTRWQSLAKQKLAEVDTLMQRAQSMRQMLKQGLHCSCSDLEQCIDCVLKIHCKGQRQTAVELPQL